MDPSKKRKIRLVVALGAAVLLAGGLIYTSIGAATEAAEPSDVLLTAKPDKTYDLTGKVKGGTVERGSEELRFEVEDRDGAKSIPVRYTGTVPDPFREGREIIVTGKLRGETFVADEDSLITRCPSKFSDEDGGQDAPPQ